LQVENIIDEDPNKAMQMLYEMENAQNKPGEDGDKSDIEHSRLDTKEDSALFGLLYIAAIHKIGLEIRNDSLITNSVDYYRQQKDHTRLAKALLHLGITHQSNGRWKDAVTCLKEAEGMIDDCNDKVFCYDVYDAIGNLNAAANCRELMLTYYQRALASATAMNSNSRKAASLNKLIRAYIHQGQLDSAKVYVEQAKPLLSSVERQVQSDLLVSFGCNALEEKDTVKEQYHHGRCDVGSPWAKGTVSNCDAVDLSEE
jgi:tetratricopeptide (TPR) repeat protein